MMSAQVVCDIPCVQKASISAACSASVHGGARWRWRRALPSTERLAKAANKGLSLEPSSGDRVGVEGAGSVPGLGVCGFGNGGGVRADTESEMHEPMLTGLMRTELRGLEFVVATPPSSSSSGRFAP